MRKIILCLVSFSLFTSLAYGQSARMTPIIPSSNELSVSIQGDEIVHCYQADESYALYHNGLWWAWIAPTASSWGGLTPGPELIGDGWRWVADEAEWAKRPEATEFQNANKCAAETFFTTSPQCDWGDPYYTDSTHPGGYLTYYLDGSLSELWIVHDDCPDDPDRDVPEFTVIGAGLVLAGAGFYINKKKKE